MTLAAQLAWLPARVAELSSSCGIPGMAVGVLHDGERFTTVTGVTHSELGYPVLPRTVFQIGSNTKLLTATATMRLVERGSLGLDDPVRRHLPSFQLRDPDGEHITVRHLLTHTSGIDGDVTGPEQFGPDVQERYAAQLSDIGLLHPPGTHWSYCNAGWALLGRVLEVVTGQRYSDLLEELVLRPLGMSRTFVLPEQMLGESVAFGHLPSAEGGYAPAPVFATAPGCAPAGSVPVASIDDVLTFLQAHFDDGVAADGTQFLQSSTVRAMQQHQVAIPPIRQLHGMGLGWLLGTTEEGERVVGHGGGTLGQIAMLETLPDQQLAVVILTNSFGGAMAGPELLKELLLDLAGATFASGLEPPDEPPSLDLAPYAGTYQRRGTTVRLTAQGNALVADIEEEPPIPEAKTAPLQMTLLPLDPERFVIQGSGGVVHFLDLHDTGVPSYLFNFRLLQRVTP
ncbi:MAG: beta-lactamase [Frankiales bacterium]|nr:beta-lactamase [Frankiales bacterium]